MGSLDGLEDLGHVVILHYCPGNRNPRKIIDAAVVRDAEVPMLGETPRVGPQQVIGGRYRLLDRLGQGGMSVVWRATDEILGRTVAVKVLLTEKAADPATKANALAEAQAAARVSHPNLARVFDYGEWLSPKGHAQPYVVMELITGRSLAQRLDAGADAGPLEPGQALRVAGEVAAGLAAAHDSGLVHRDVKPGNVILSPTGAKVVDFGIAALAGEREVADADGYVLGTPSYLPPERLRSGVVLPASDMYAWGVLLHRMLTGRLPWPSGATLTQRAEHLRELAPLPGVPAEIDGVFRRCLAPDPAERPTAHEAALVVRAPAGIGVVLGDADDGLGLIDEATVHVGPARRGSWRRARAAAIAAVPTAIVAVVLASATSPSRPAPLDDAQIGLGQLPSLSGAPAVTHDPVAPGTPIGALPGMTIGPAPGVSPLPPIGATSGATSPPATTAASTGTSPTRAPKTAGPVTLPSPGGIVVATCVGGLVNVLSASPGSGFALHGNLPGLGSDVEVRFREYDGTEVRMSITCSGGVPVSTYTIEGE